jgi:hypothetical protein
MIDLDDCHDALYVHDDVHLYCLRKDIFINALYGAIEQFILTPRQKTIQNESVAL